MRNKTELQNRGVIFHYEILEKFTAGLALRGFEVKAIKTGRGSLNGSYVSALGNELYLISCQIPAYQPKNAPKDYIETQPRKLLLQRAEIRYLIGKLKEKGLTLVPLRLFTKKGLIKIELALAKGLKKYEKREKIRKRDFQRERDRAMGEKF